MRMTSQLCITTLVLSFIGLIFFHFPFNNAALADTGRVLSGEYEFGEKYTTVYVDPDVAEDARDDEELDRYRFTNTWLQLDQDLKPSNRVSIRAQQLDRNYVDRPALNNSSRYAQVRLSLEPADGWAVWPHVSIRQRDYDQRPLDNTIFTTGVEARYRWGVRHAVRFGASYVASRYDDDDTRDRDQGLVFASWERPVNDRLTLKVGGRAEAVDFSTPSTSRENATRGSASIGFRYEL